MEFSPINFNDLMVIWGIYSWKPEYRAVMGNEGAGKVIAVGEGVSPVNVGDRSSCPSPPRKWQQRVLVPATSWSSFRPTPIHGKLRMMAINPVTAELLLATMSIFRPGDAMSTTLRPRDSLIGWQPSLESAA